MSKLEESSESNLQINKCYDNISTNKFTVICHVLANTKKKYILGYYSRYKKRAINKMVKKKKKRENHGNSLNMKKKKKRELWCHLKAVIRKFDPRLLKNARDACERA